MFTDVFFMDFRFDLCRFSEALGAVFLLFAALETGLKIDVFSGGGADPK